ncbi:hypothetical protein SLEP1_g15011 [Rubroshorea leprosula]|uniref:Uncharacterized protein n=1 Tax=Rubroshorea leprosula TaxID=152421 RepID=A0AAV5IQC2_9ROSI|nr:hypothetical protein SLEP1_g15011 [Rubroshorea leprosula]
MKTFQTSLPLFDHPIITRSVNSIVTPRSFDRYLLDHSIVTRSVNPIVTPSVIRPLPTRSFDRYSFGYSIVTRSVTRSLLVRLSDRYPLVIRPLPARSSNRYSFGQSDRYLLSHSTVTYLSIRSLFVRLSDRYPFGHSTVTCSIIRSLPSVIRPLLARSFDRYSFGHPIVTPRSFGRYLLDHSIVTRLLNRYCSSLLGRLTVAIHLARSFDRSYPSCSNISSPHTQTSRQPYAHARACAPRPTPCVPRTCLAPDRLHSAPAHPSHHAPYAPAAAPNQPLPSAAPNPRCLHACTLRRTHVACTPALCASNHALCSLQYLPENLHHY